MALPVDISHMKHKPCLVSRVTCRQLPLFSASGCSSGFVHIMTDVFLGWSVLPLYNIAAVMLPESLAFRKHTEEDVNLAATCPILNTSGLSLTIVATRSSLDNGICSGSNANELIIKSWCLLHTNHTWSSRYILPCQFDIHDVFTSPERSPTASYCCETVFVVLFIKTEVFCAAVFLLKGGS